MSPREGYQIINVRVPTGLRERVDQYLLYMAKPYSERPRNTEDWPTTLTEVVKQGLEEFLVHHPQLEKEGAPKKPRTDIKPKNP